MAIQNKTTLKTFFNTGDIPTEGQYHDFIDSSLILNDNNIGNITASGVISASGINDHIFGGTLIVPQIIASQSFGNSSSFGHLVIGNVYTGSSDVPDGGRDYVGFAHMENQLDTDVNSDKYKLSNKNAFIIYQKSTDTLFLNTTGSQGEVHIRTDLNTPSSSVIFKHEETNFYQNITSSADISSSRDIIGRTGSFQSIAVVDHGNIHSSGYANISGNISSSGTITANSFTSTGDNAGGINFSDGVIITGSITASGNISSSNGGNINTDNFIGSRPILQKTSNVTLALSDRGTYNRCGSHLITIPLDSAVDFAIGTEIEFIQTSSAGHLAFASSSNSVIINSRFALHSASGQFSAVSCKKIADNEWDMIGDLTA
tara:strand:+ start:695 stop:1813 length:1119 start_codon:yes stop_codon:yes gene_type:complete